MDHTTPANDSSSQQVSGTQQVGSQTDLKGFAKTVSEQKEWITNVRHSQGRASFPKVDAVNCTKIWGNDQQEVRAAHDYQQSHGTQPTKNVRHYLQETANCTSYLLNGGFLSASVDEKELSFPLAFSLAAYKDVEQVERLLRAVYRPHNVYCIHPDNKSSDDFHSSLRFIAGCLPNVNIVERPLSEVDDKERKHFQRYKVWMYDVKNYTGVCDGKAVRGVCHFGVGDVPRMVVSPHLFANKFSYDFMPLAYDCVEEWYWHKVHLENVGQAPTLNLTPYEMSTMVTKRYDGPVKIWE
ncbi:hypothetical protein C0Q70_14386 [Pomacea canaliculata]|uniref:Uncharacterized protein n=1 Tax=Pomacea canaliculata TaxID=400727 RepID=A0A2T7NZV4_POMCA|nr:hypothetical protein C0Q70_14386 [Pomacea canaliculata]